jgi:hypothetical protein
MRGCRLDPARLWALLLAFALLTGCMAGAAPAQVAPTVAPSRSATLAATAAPAASPVPAPTVPPGPTATSSPTAAAQPWSNDRIVYEIFVRDGDPNTTDDPGVTGIWLMPVNPSPSYHGYDVTNYRASNPQYGTLEHFNAFLYVAYKWGIKVVTDLIQWTVDGGFTTGKRWRPYFEDVKTRNVAAQDGDPDPCNGRVRGLQANPNPAALQYIRHPLRTMNPGAVPDKTSKRRHP